MSSSASIAIIGGSGFSSLAELRVIKTEQVMTEFGAPSAPLVYAELAGRSLVFLARHGDPHTIPPHQVNYRANMLALKEAGVKQVFALAAVGGMGDGCTPGALVIPDQIIDYTYGRQQTYFEENLEQVTHIDFTYPYTEVLRTELKQAAVKAQIELVTEGVYAATQGPRLETAAEVRKLEHDGCTIVGMTGMPEAALARELELEYACLAVVANWAAGKRDVLITMPEIEKTLQRAHKSVNQLLLALFSR
ncbi:MAG: S-methyl-5'-thioinosine phosphorylase [Gammaproteobacteria bacterium]|nr:S-methyl-5'-thioinosine phosphorylase [Gammaproteobacteria bacterium]